MTLALPMEPSEDYPVERRKQYRRDFDHTKPIYMSRTVLCSVFGMVVSIASILGEARVSEMLLPFLTLLSSFGAFVFRIVATRMIG